MAKIFSDDQVDFGKGKAVQINRQRLSVGNKSTVARSVSRTPEVMVKIISQAKNRSAGKSMKNIRSTVDYISRDGEVAVFDEQGNQFSGKNEAGIEGLSSWRGIPESDGKRREALHIVFSMPKPANLTDVTPREEVTRAVRRFAEKEWANHQYVYAQHDDTEHAHTHVVLNMNPIEGTKRLNPRKADLQRWRERFAEQLREQGIEANATQRAARGVTKLPQKQSVIHINKRAIEKGTPLANVTQRQEQAAVDELRGSVKSQPFMGAIMEKRKQVLTEYAAVAKQLLMGSPDDKQLAGDVIKFATSLPPPQTQHQERVAELRQDSQKPELELEPEPEQGR